MNFSRLTQQRNSALTPPVTSPSPTPASKQLANPRLTAQATPATPCASPKTTATQQDCTQAHTAVCEHLESRLTLNKLRHQLRLANPSFRASCTKVVHKSPRSTSYQRVRDALAFRAALPPLSQAACHLLMEAWLTSSSLKSSAALKRRFSSCALGSRAGFRGMT